MYSVFGYGSMIADQVRTGAFARAMRQVIRPGTVVVDIGTGTGIFALLACQLGAGRVFAIEPSPVIELARETAAANGHADRIEFIQDYSYRVSLSRRADVIVSDMYGVLPLNQHRLPSLIDARRRLLAADGVMIPQRDTLWAALVEAPNLYAKHASPWDEKPYGLDMGPVRRRTVNSWLKGRVAPQQLLVEGQSWGTLDYACIEGPNVAGELSWTITRAGTAHGLAVWFDACLTENVGFTNTPSEPELIYANAFFPWTAPVALTDGDQVSVTLAANLVGADYVWRWDSRVRSGKGNQLKADFRQSSFYGAPLTLAQLHRREASHAPSLNDNGKLDLMILGLMNDRIPMGEIARRIADRCPERFRRWEQALSYVGELADKYVC